MLSHSLPVPWVRPSTQTNRLLVAHDGWRWVIDRLFNAPQLPGPSRFCRSADPVSSGWMIGNDAHTVRAVVGWGWRERRGGLFFSFFLFFLLCKPAFCISGWVGSMPACVPCMHAGMVVYASCIPTYLLRTALGQERKKKIRTGLIIHLSVRFSLFRDRGGGVGEGLRGHDLAV